MRYPRVRQGCSVGPPPDPARCVFGGMREEGCGVMWREVGRGRRYNRLRRDDTVGNLTW